MRLSDAEYACLQESVKLIKKRKKEYKMGIQSAICDLPSLSHKNKALTPYVHNKIVNSIAIPLAYMFFLSHSVFNGKEGPPTEELAEFIELHTLTISPL